MKKKTTAVFLNRVLRKAMYERKQHEELIVYRRSSFECSFIFFWKKDSKIRTINFRLSVPTRSGFGGYIEWQTANDDFAGLIDKISETIGERIEEFGKEELTVSAEELKKSVEYETKEIKTIYERAGRQYAVRSAE